MIAPRSGLHQLRHVQRGCGVPWSRPEGDIQIPSSQMTSKGTIDEPIKDTILRDVRSVCRKVAHVIFPRRGHELLSDWDLWGPFFIFIVLALVLQLSHGQKEDAGAPQFAQVFTVFWFGVIAVSLNAKLLGGNLSFCQTVCVLGYCILPLVISLVINVVIKLATSTSIWVLLIRLAVVFVGLAYSLFSAATFLAPSSKPTRVALVVYPLCLFYFFIGWLVFVNTGTSKI
ncbi:Protein YIPF6 [Taenia crassiceps]|uniref:Protein YIPF n=1 Tax=Taenia crassiceps TaxID=6207 RepID=A0ABR4QLT8_9CEST